MSKNKVLIFSLIASFPFISSAQGPDLNFSNDFAFASLFAGNFSILLSLVIGSIATSLVFRAAQKMGGGLFGSVLNYIAVGMVMIILGTLSVVLEPWLVDLWLGVINTIFFSLGYIFMVVGANKLLKGILSD